MKKANLKFVKDFILNIITSALPLAVLQLLVLPYIGRTVTPEKYGLILTMISLIYIIPQAFGNALNNTRLIRQSDYYEAKAVGDYRLLFRISSFLNIVLSLVFFFIFDTDVTAINCILFLIISALWLASSYYTVVFRIDLDFTGYLIHNVLLSLGYGLGLLLFVYTGYWQLVFLFGLLFSLAFIVFRKKITRESSKITPLFKETAKKDIVLLASCGLVSIYTYLDRLLILPILGGTAVSIYYAATVFTKLISLLIGPLSTVILSYLARRKNADIQLFNGTLVLGIVVGVIGYILCIFLGKYILMLLYPQFMEQALQYIYITSATTMILVLSSLLNPFVLKYCKTIWQIIIELIGTSLYIILAFLLVGKMSIWGICIAYAITTPIKVLIQISIFYITYYKKKKLLCLLPDAVYFRET